MASLKLRPKSTYDRPRSGCCSSRCSYACRASTRGEPRWRGSCTRYSTRCASGPANLVALLRLLRGHLRGLDLSHLALRGAYLQEVEMQDASLVGVTLRDTVFTEALDATWSVAISRNGQYWAAGSRRGEVRVWREAGQTLHLVWQAHTDTVSALAFSPDERRLASGSWDGTITLWELERGVPLWTVWQTTCVSLAFSPD